MAKRTVALDPVDLDAKPPEEMLVDLNTPEDEAGVEVKPEPVIQDIRPAPKEDKEDKKDEPKVLTQEDLDKAIADTSERLTRVHQQQMTQLGFQARQIAEENNKLRQIAPDEEDGKFETAITTLSKQLEQAHEKGETGEAVKLTRQLGQLEAQREIRRVTRAAQTQQQQPFPIPQPQNILPEPTRKWVESNNWFNDPKYGKEKGYALSIDKELMGEGFDPNSSRYYEELDKRMGNAFPYLKPKTTEETTEERPSGGKPPVAPVSRGGSAPSAVKGRVTLDQADLKSMQTFGLDPANPAHLREWAKNKSASR